VKRFFVILIILLCNHRSFSQGPLFIRAGVGIIYYNGDLNDRILTHPKLVKPAVTVAAGYYIFNRLSLSVHYYTGKLLGNDAYAQGNGYQQRNLSFQTRIHEVSFITEISLFAYRTKWFINPFLMGGVGIFSFRPEAMMDGNVVSLQPLGTEGQYIPNGGNPEPYKLTQIVAPAALGFYMKLSPSFRLRFEISNHFTFTDYLDDVSKNYPDSALLAATPNGPTAVLFSSRRKDGKFPSAGSERGNNFANDSYTTVMISIVYNPPFRKNKGPGKNELDKCFGF
jgi:hypothetical protein